MLAQKMEMDGDEPDPKGPVYCDHCIQITEGDVYCEGCAHVDAASRVREWAAYKLSLGQISPEAAEELESLAREFEVRP